MLGASLDSFQYMDRLNAELERIDREAMIRWANHIFRAWEQEKFVYLIGNGGSGTTASHMAEDLG